VDSNHQCRLLSGSQWDLVADDVENFSWQTVYTYFRQWKLSGKWLPIHAVLCAQVRKMYGKE
jgi:hypothetical protein